MEETECAGRRVPFLIDASLAAAGEERLIRIGSVIARSSGQEEVPQPKELVFTYALPTTTTVDEQETLTMIRVIKLFIRDQSGATAIEYGLLVSLIGVAIILGATAIGTKVNTTFNSIATKINGPAA